MPNYVYRCSCGDFERYHPIGNAPRVEPCEECGRPAMIVLGAGVHVAPSALENKGQAVRDTNAREKRWDKDMPAYRRMRHRGMQPRQIDGAARTEDNVDDQIDIDLQHIIGQDKDHTRENIHDAVIEVEERNLMGQNLPIRKDYSKRKAAAGVSE